jgi:hypothetical protein
LSSYDWPSVHNDTSVDAAVDRLNIAATPSIDFAIIPATLRSLNILPFFFLANGNFLLKRDFLYTRLKVFVQILMINFLSYHELVKTSVTGFVVPNS